MIKRRSRQGSTIYAPICVCCEEAHVSLVSSKVDYFKFTWECDECGSQFDYVTGDEVHHEPTDKTLSVCITKHAGIGNRVRYLPYQGDSSGEGHDSRYRDNDEREDDEEGLAHLYLLD